MNTKSIGDLAEKKAACYLTENGYTIIEKNYRYKKLGEIDIIAKKDEYICFVEVKSRKSTEFGMPCQAVNYKKQEKIKRTAKMYLLNTNQIESFIRFDIVEVFLNNNKIELIEDAF